MQVDTMLSIATVYGLVGLLICGVAMYDMEVLDKAKIQLSTVKGMFEFLHLVVIVMLVWPVLIYLVATRR